jgi:hypothetical protein
MVIESDLTGKHEDMKKAGEFWMGLIKLIGLELSPRGNISLSTFQKSS